LRAKRPLLLFLLPLAAYGAPTTTISYHQTGACNGGQGQPGGPSTYYNAGPKQAYVVFGIEGIDNSQNAATFNFDPTKMYVNSARKDFVDPSLAIYKWVLGPFASVATPIGGRGSIYYGMRGQNALVVQTTNTNGSVEAHQTSYLLNYKTGAGAPRW
jgi:hypothetical protein